MIEIKCNECYYPIKGKSIKHAEENLKIHKKSKRHRQLKKLVNELYSELNKSVGGKNGNRTTTRDTSK